VDLLHRAVRARQTPEGLRALSKDRPINPESVERYRAGKFGEALEDVREPMTALARCLPLSELALRAYELYEAFRPEVPPGKRAGAPDCVSKRIVDIDGSLALARNASLGSRKA
jgi:hypothetical protein